MDRAGLCCGLLSLLFWVTAAPAEEGPEEAYVIDRLLIGVHKDKDLESEIVKVLPTGTKVQVLQREKGIAQVRGPEGDTGWVDAGYLMRERPAAQVAEALEGKNKALAAELAALKAELVDRQGAVGGNGEAASAEASPGKGAALPDPDPAHALAQERSKVEALEAELAALRSDPGRTQNPGARGAGGEQPLAATGPLAALSPITFGMAVALLLTVGFAAGVYVTDYLQRRRHGGFRV